MALCQGGRLRTRSRETRSIGKKHDANPNFSQFLNRPTIPCALIARRQASLSQVARQAKPERVPPRRWPLAPGTAETRRGTAGGADHFRRGDVPRGFLCGKPRLSGGPQADRAALFL